VLGTHKVVGCDIMMQKNVLGTHKVIFSLYSNKLKLII
jgi:hypothetical protein